VKEPKKPRSTRRKALARVPSDAAPRCGLCGKHEQLTRTDCCGQWICDDEDNYGMGLGDLIFEHAKKV
jgi:hypothetical protein